MDFNNIRTREDIFNMGITASVLVSMSSQLTDMDRNNIRNNMGDIWIPYTYGKDSVTIEVLKMPFYSFLLSYGDQGDIQGVKKYCSHSIDILNRNYNIYIGQLFISRYGKDDPISKIISLFIYDRTYYKIHDDIIHYNTTRGDRYKIIPRGYNSIENLSEYMPRRTIECVNGDIILKTGFCYFYNCVPLAYYEEYEDVIDIIDLDGNFHQLILDDGIVISGFEDLSSVFTIRNDSIMDVYDIYRLLKLGMNPNTLIRKYGFNYKVVGFLDTIDSIVVWQASTIVTYKDGHINVEIGNDRSTNIIEHRDNMYSIDYQGRTVAYMKDGYINFLPIEYNFPMDIDGYSIIIDDNDNLVRIVGTNAM